MSVRTVCRGSYDVRADVTRNEPFVFEFSDRTVGQDVPFDGTDFAYVGWAEYGGTETLKWALRDGVTVAEYRDTVANVYGLTYGLNGALAPGPVPLGSFTERHLLYVEDLSWRNYFYYGDDTHRLRIESEPDPGDSFIELRSYFSGTVTLNEHYSGWVNALVEHHRSGEMKAKVWAGLGAAEPDDWMMEIESGVDNRNNPLFAPMPRVLAETLGTTSVFDTARIEWEAIE